MGRNSEEPSGSGRRSRAGRVPWRKTGPLRARYRKMSKEEKPKNGEQS